LNADTGESESLPQQCDKPRTDSFPATNCKVGLAIDYGRKSQNLHYKKKTEAHLFSFSGAYCGAGRA
jgi:hypothetical protein